jgi:hypothetical protein
MECQRCSTSKEAKYRVYTDIIDMKVCAACADEARRLGIGVEVLDSREEKNKRTKSEPNLQDCRLEFLDSSR